MSYYVSVWEGTDPLSNAHAASEFRRRRSLQNPEPPGPRVERLLSELLATSSSILDLPRSSRQELAESLVGCVYGATVILPVFRDRWYDAVDELIALTRYYGLVLFDPQRAELLPSAVHVERRLSFALPPSDQIPMHLKAILDEGLQTPHPMMGVLEDPSSGFYVQWLTSGGNVVIEAQGESLVASDLKLSKKQKSQMIEAGFADGDPNWTAVWEAHKVDTIAAAQALATVLVGIRQFNPGRPLVLHTFPQIASESSV